MASWKHCQVAGQQPQIENNEPDLSPIKEAIVETAKAQSGEIKGLLDKHWKAYAQISTLILHHLDTIKKSQDEQGVQQEPQPQEHIHRHSFDIKSSKVFSFVVGLGVACAYPCGAISRNGSPIGSIPMMR